MITTEDKTREIGLELSKRQIPCRWEMGGGLSNTGDASVISNRHGGPKPAIYVRTAGQLACSWHALVPVEQGDFFVMARHHREDFTITICEVIGIVKSTNEEGNPIATALVREVNSFSEGEWDIPLEEKLQAVVKAAMSKATCYHCREPHYVKQ